MSTTTLTSLHDYLYGAFTSNNIRWVAKHLIEHTEKKEPSQKPYTIEDFHARIARAEADIAARRITIHEEVMRE